MEIRLGRCGITYVLRQPQLTVLPAAMRYLHIFIVLVVLLPQSAAAQELDSLLITFTQYTEITQAGIFTNCLSQFVGSHADPVGNGNDLDYTYFFDVGSTISDGYQQRHPLDWENPPQDTAGVIITFLGGVTTSSGPGGDCGPTFSNHAAAWAGFTVYVHFPKQANEPPVAFFTYEADAENPLLIHFDGSGSEDEDGDIVSYEWDFPNGASGSGATPSHTFEKRGTYTVTLTVTDDDNEQSAPFSREVEVKAPAMRYDLSLERASQTGNKAAQDDEPPVFVVGDQIWARIRVENTGDFPLENIRLPEGDFSLEIQADTDSAIEIIQADQAEIQRLEEGQAAVLSYLLEAKETTGLATIIATQVEAEALLEAANRRRIVEATTTCPINNKGNQDDEASNGCATLSVVSPLLISLDLLPNPVPPNEPMILGDTLLVQARVRNVGTTPITDVVPAGVIEVTGEGSLSLVTTVEPDRVPVLAPDQSRTFFYFLKATTPGEATIALPDIVGFNEAGDEVLGEGDGTEWCEGLRCRVTVGIVAPAVEITLRTTQGEGEDLQVKAGLIYEPGFPIRPMEQIEAGGSLASINFLCRSTCVDVEVFVADPENGEPASEVSVTLSTPGVTGEAVITPPGSGGYFCERPKSFGGRADCGNPLMLETDDEGKVNAYYAVPGVTEDTVTQITAVAQTDGGQETDEAALTIAANIVHQASAIISRDEAILLSGVSTTALAALSVSIVGESCKAMLNAIAGPVSTGGGTFSDPTINSAASTAVEFLCALVPTQPIEGPAGIIKRVSEVGQWSWYFDRFGIDAPGIINVGFRPPPQFIDVENDFLAVLNEGFAQAVNLGAVGGTTSVMPGSQIEVTFFEMSYLDRNAISTPLTRALYYTMTVTPPGRSAFEYKQLMTEGTYNPETWLLPPRDRFLNDVIERAQAGDTEVMMGGPGGSADGIAKNKTSTASFLPGDLVVVGFDTETAETNQLIAVEGRALMLAAPLSHDHAEGALLVRIAEGTAGPPAPPLLIPPTDETGAVSFHPELAWMPRPQSFVVSYDLELATDSLFTDIVAEAEGLTELVFEPGALAAHQDYYWRMRASNLGSDGMPGAWSRVLVFATGATPVDTEDVGEVPGEFVLEANYPNPFNPQTVIPYVLPVTSEARLTVYDVLGREVAVLVEGTQPAGRHEVVFEADNLPSGVYLYRIEAGTVSIVRQMLLLK